MAIMEDGGDPRPYTRLEWCDLCDSPWDYIGQQSRRACLKCRTLSCAECGKAYEATARDAEVARASGKRYCSRACWDKAREPGRHECGQCGASFRARPDSANKYCSRACAFKDQDAWTSTAGSVPRIKRTCESCGAAYLRAHSKATYRNKYCGPACEGVGQEKECRRCGAMFSATFYVQVLCSDECALEDSRVRARARFVRKTDRPYAMVGPEPRICVGCWGRYLGARNQKYCSARCRSRTSKKPKVLVAGSVLVARHFLVASD